MKQQPKEKNSNYFWIPFEITSIWRHIAFVDCIWPHSSSSNNNKWITIFTIKLSKWTVNNLGFCLSFFFGEWSLCLFQYPLAMKRSSLFIFAIFFPSVCDEEGCSPTCLTGWLTRQHRQQLDIWVRLCFSSKKEFTVLSCVYTWH